MVYGFNKDIRIRIIYLPRITQKAISILIISIVVLVLIVEETLNLTYKRILLCEVDAILFALMLNKSVKSQNPPGASLAPMSIISDVTPRWVGDQLQLL